MEVISAWELYLWTRLDALVDLFNTLSGIGLAVFVVMLIAGLFWKIDGHDPDQWSSPHLRESSQRSNARFTALFKSKLWYLLLFFVLSCFVLSKVVPTKKDAAIIFVLPQITNSHAIQQEAGEIYQIAKDALRELVAEKKAD